MDGDGGRKGESLVILDIYNDIMNICGGKQEGGLGGYISNREVEVVNTARVGFVYDLVGV